jgi:UDPglucose 6-dehydrogenase
LCPDDDPERIATLQAGRLAERAGVDFGLLKEAEGMNKGPVDVLLEKVRHALRVVKGTQVGVLGLAFKPNTDDIRLAPSIAEHVQ